jgi:preprotein translocase subunit SecG
MQFLMNMVLVVQLLSAVAIVFLVLLQHGKGADMGASFGSGASGTLFGATGSANVLSRATSVCATLFFVSTLGMAYISGSREAAPTAPGLLDATPAAASAPVTGAAAVPGAVAPASAASQP